MPYDRQTLGAAELGSSAPANVGLGKAFAKTEVANGLFLRAALSSFPPYQRGSKGDALLDEQGLESDTIKAVLKAIAENGPLVIGELVEITGLNARTIRSAIVRMKHDKFLRVEGERQAETGHPSIVYGLTNTGEWHAEKLIEHAPPRPRKESPRAPRSFEAMEAKLQELHEINQTTRLIETKAFVSQLDELNSLTQERHDLERRIAMIVERQKRIFQQLAAAAPKAPTAPSPPVVATVPQSPIELVDIDIDEPSDD